MCRGLHAAALGSQPHWTAWAHSLWCVGCCVRTPIYRLMALPSGWPHTGSVAMITPCLVHLCAHLEPLIDVW